MTLITEAFLRVSLPAVLCAREPLGFQRDGNGGVEEPRAESLLGQALNSAFSTAFFT